jgi:hypothetical protein
MRRTLLLVFSFALLVSALPTQATPPFCNTQGFPYCEAFDGAGCGPYNPHTQRCIAPGICEWGVCNCDGSNYHCVW